MSEYTKIIGLKYPDVRCHASGPNYGDIVWVGATSTTIPIPQNTLDADITAMDGGSLQYLSQPDRPGMMMPFVSNTSNVSNAYMSIYGDIASNTNGIVLPHNGTIMSAIISLASIPSSTATFYIRKNRSFSTNIATLSFPATSTKAAIPVNVNVSALDELCVYVGNISVSRPIVTLEVAWR